LTKKYWKEKENAFSKKFGLWMEVQIPLSDTLETNNHILCAIRIYWHLVYVPRNNFFDTEIADVYLMSVINVKMSFLGI
jgi:hypothetical protein